MQSHIFNYESHIPSLPLQHPQPNPRILSALPTPTNQAKATHCDSESALHCRKKPRLRELRSEALWLVRGIAMIFLHTEQGHVESYSTCCRLNLSIM